MLVVISKNRQKKCDKGLHEYGTVKIPMSNSIHINTWLQCIHCQKIKD